MAKTGDTSDRKPKAGSRAKRPSFAPVAAPAASSAWVYRSDAAAPKAGAPKATAPKTKPPKAAPAARQVAAKATVPVGLGAAGPGRLTQALDVVTLPIAVTLMAVLVPVRWLLGPRH